MLTYWKPFSILIGIFGLMMFFQNCSSAVPFSNVDRFSTLVQSKVFPYEAEFDQIAYMSCSEQENVSQDEQTFFTFRVGAYNNGGLRVSPDFRSEVVRLPDENVVSALSQNAASSGSQLQFAIRTMDNLQLIYRSEDNGEGIEGIDYDNVLSPFGDPKFTDLLWYMEPNDYLQFWAGAQFDSDYRFEGSLRFMDSEIIEGDLRNFLSNRGVLALTFSESTTVAPRGPATVGGTSTNATRDVFGMAVAPRFKQPLNPQGGSPGSDMPKRVLSSIQEVVIDSRKGGTIPRTWECADSMQFMIVLPDDVERNQNGVISTRCATQPDPVQPSALLKAIRRSLPSEDWFVDLARKCVVPKRDRTGPGSCYGLNSNTQQTHLINYDNFSGGGCGFGLNKPGLCPHYVSICVRQ